MSDAPRNVQPPRYLLDFPIDGAVAAYGLGAGSGSGLSGAASGRDVATTPGPEEGP